MAITESDPQTQTETHHLKTGEEYIQLDSGRRLVWQLRLIARLRRFMTPFLVAQIVGYNVAVTYELS